MHFEQLITYIAISLLAANLSSADNFANSLGPDQGLDPNSLTLIAELSTERNFDKGIFERCRQQQKYEKLH